MFLMSTPNSSTAWLPLLAIAGILSAGPLARCDQEVLNVKAQKPHSFLWWLARAEEEAMRWGNPQQGAYSLAEIARVLADHDKLDEALAMARRVEHRPALLSARYRIAAAHVRNGELEAARALAVTPLAPGERVEPDACVEIACRTALALAEGGHVKECGGEKCEPAKIASARARIHAALALTHALAGRLEPYVVSIDTAEAHALSIPGDIDAMWAELLSSERRPGVPTDPNPINAIYKGDALRSVAVARARAEDLEGARRALDAFSPGRRRDASHRFSSRRWSGQATSKLHRRWQQQSPREITASLPSSGSSKRWRRPAISRPPRRSLRESMTRPIAPLPTCTLRPPRTGREGAWTSMRSSLCHEATPRELRPAHESAWHGGSLPARRHVARPRRLPVDSGPRRTAHSPASKPRFAIL